MPHVNNVASPVRLTFQFSVYPCNGISGFPIVFSIPLNNAQTGWTNEDPEAPPTIPVKFICGPSPSLAWSCNVGPCTAGGPGSPASISCNPPFATSAGNLNASCCSNDPPINPIYEMYIGNNEPSPLGEMLPITPYYCCGSCNTRSGQFLSATSDHPVIYATGEVRHVVQDLNGIGFAGGLGHSRTYCNRMSVNDVIGNGFNWQVQQWPYLVFHLNGTISVQGRASGALWFDPAEGGGYVGRFNVPQTFSHNPTAWRFILTELDGTQLEFTENTGAFNKQITPAGHARTVTQYAPDNLCPAIIECVDSSSTPFVTVQLQYTYDASSGDNLISSIILRRREGVGVWRNIERVLYSYYGVADEFGMEEDLESATTEVWNEAAWQPIGTRYYRYYRQAFTSSSSSSLSSSSSSGNDQFQPHLLKFVLNPAAFDRLKNDPNVSDPFTASNAIVSLYADYYFEYDAHRRVTREIVNSGSHTYEFSYAQSEFSDAYNHWKTKTTETLPDGNQRIVYTNYAGQPMLNVFASEDGIWCDFQEFNEQGKTVLIAKPSAITGYDDQYPDLLHLVDDRYEFLRDHDGLIYTYQVHEPTGWPTSERIQRGQLGTCIRLNEHEYSAFYANGGGSSSSSSSPSDSMVYLLTKTIIYPDDGCGCDCNSSSSSSCSSGNCCSNDGTRQIITTYDYKFYSGTTQVQQKTTTLPAIPVEQNGSGIPATNRQYFDSFGNLIWSMDERGFITGMTYDIPTGALTRKTDDVDTGLVDAPAGWVTPSGGGKHLITDFKNTPQGRRTESLGPSHTIDLNGVATVTRQASWVVYKDVDFQIWSVQGYATGGGPDYQFTLVNPVSITQMDASGKVLEKISAVRASTLGKLEPSDSFPQSSYVRWTTHQFTDCCLAASQRVYHTIPSSGEGERDVNYDESDYGYDVMKRQNRTVTPGGTITFRVFDARGQVVAIYIGTNDNGATDQDPTGGGATSNNMVVVTSQQYDNGEAGCDGNLTLLTQHVDSLTVRLTKYLYDWRDRQIATDGEIDFYQTVCYDNLNHVIRTDRRNTTAAGNLIGRNETQYDDRGQVFRAHRYAVNPATGTVGNALTDEIWRDASGRVIKSKLSGSQLFTKTKFDSLGQMKVSYLGYDLNETTYSNIEDVSDDVILDQSETDYDDASNVIESRQRQRYHNAPDSQRGPLQDPQNAPRARVTYSAIWPDAVGRSQASANYGTNGGTVLSRPGIIPDNNDLCLVTSSDYSAVGNLLQTTDPGGMVTRFGYDDAGRQTSRILNFIENASSSSSSSSSSSQCACEPSADQNVTTLTTYNADGNVATLTVINSTTGHQTTHYIYGTTLVDSAISTSILRRTEIYPDSIDEDDVIRFEYNRQRQVTKMTDQAGTIHEYDFDLLSRQCQDRVTALGANVDDAVLRIETTFEVRGMIEHITSYNAPTVGMGIVDNDCYCVYNDFGQLVIEYQSHDGSVDTDSTPKIQYGYDNGSTNTIRATSMTYPNGRVLNYVYGTTGGINDAVSRVACLIDDDSTTHLVAYSYIGLDIFVVADYEQAETCNTIVAPSGSIDPDTGDIYTGFDRFGRIKDCIWLNYHTSLETERFWYGYDRVGNRVWQRNVVAAQAGHTSDELYYNDRIHRLVRMERGALLGSASHLENTTNSECWSLDESGNWKAYNACDSAGLHTSQSRSTNLMNEITSIVSTTGASWATPIYTRTGAMTEMPLLASPSDASLAHYDPWNRMVYLNRSATGNDITVYRYDGRGFGITKASYAESCLVELDNFYFSAEWQLVETQTHDEITNTQYVWGKRGIDDLVLRDDTNRRLYGLTDAHQSITSVIDSSGTVQERYAYSPYGLVSYYEPDFESRDFSALSWTFLYSSYHYDHLAGLYWIRKRMYHPGLGTWIQRDPLQMRVALTPYEYCDGMPLTRSDPSGAVPCADRDDWDKTMCAECPPCTCAETKKGKRNLRMHINQKIQGTMYTIDALPLIKQCKVYIHLGNCQVGEFGSRTCSRGKDVGKRRIYICIDLDTEMCALDGVVNHEITHAFQLCDLADGLSWWQGNSTVPNEQAAYEVECAKRADSKCLNEKAKEMDVNMCVTLGANASSNFLPPENCEAMINRIGSWGPPVNS